MTYRCGGQPVVEQADAVISSMPLKDLIAGMNGVPEVVQTIAKGLPYRDFVTVGLLVKKLKLKTRPQSEHCRICPRTIGSMCRIPR